MIMSFSHAPLPPAPRFSRTAQLTETGIVLGEGIVIAPLMRRADGTAALAVEGREAEIFAFLSMERGGAIHPNVLHGLHGVAKSVARRDSVGAAIRLAQLGLPPLRGPRDAEMLKAGATFLAKGLSPWTVLRMAGIEGPNARLFKAEWDESLHPRDPAGRFVSTGGATAIAASAAQSLIAAGATQVAAGAYALAGGALLSLTAAGWVLSHGPKGDIQDGASYWLPGVSCENPPDEDGKAEAPGLGHNGGPALDQDSDQQPQDPNERDPGQKPQPSVIGPLTSSGSDGDGAQRAENNAHAASSLSMNDILSPNGKLVGYVNPGAGPRTRTSEPEQFDQLQSQLMDGATAIPAASGYDGVWYQRADGTMFGIRTSKNYGPTIDVIKSDHPNLKPGFKVHQR